MSRFSDDDGSLQAEHVYSAAEVTSADEPRLPNSRVVETLKSVELPDCVIESDETWYYEDQALTRNQAHELSGLVVPDGSLLLVDIVEEVDGSDVRTIGAMTSSGEVEALLPADDADGFSGAPVRTSARYRHSDGTLTYLEANPSDEAKTVMSLSVDSGQNQELGPCDTECGRVIVDPYSELVYGTIGPDEPEANGIDNNLARYFSNHDGSMVGFYTKMANGGLHLHHRAGDESPVFSRGRWPVNYSEAVGKHDLTYVAPENSAGATYAGGLPVFTVGDNELMLSDNSFTVRAFDDEFSEETADREILPGSDRVNEHPVLSGERDQILFRSSDATGNVSWFTVPVSGGDPQEIGAAEGEHATMVPIHWF
ncbi:hypothetical protein [Nocardiopsis ganjiahuensis]|uniref:hypothetical protein n=1 Tax=Nocardiopsis ganjiahuensis TaxID=239984 RepID=UPI0003628F4F|nr:hypothetical protein [Nocardiopsis ganjiahuensis]